MTIPFLCIIMPAHQRIKIAPDALPRKFFAALALHLHNIRIALARQTPLSCAEIIKSIEMDIRRLKDGYDVLDKLYDDNDLNCDNFAQAVREYRCSREIITAVANLYLRQQIMLDTY